MSKRQIVIVTNHDDWEALFVDGVQVTAGHTITRRELLKYVQEAPCDVHQWYVDPEYTSDLGGLPQSLDEIPDDQILEKDELA